jgi:hypothetical protein
MGVGSESLVVRLFGRDASSRYYGQNIIYIMNENHLIITMMDDEAT